MTILFGKIEFITVSANLLSVRTWFQEACDISKYLLYACNKNRKEKEGDERE